MKCDNIRISECEANGFTFGKMLGQGEYGCVYIACKNGECKYIAKIQPNSIASENEVHYLLLLQDNTVNLPITEYVDNFLCDNLDVIIMERYDGSLYNLLYNVDGYYGVENKKKILNSVLITQLESMREKLAELSIGYADWKEANVMYSADGDKITLFLGDFGLTEDMINMNMKERERLSFISEMNFNEMIKRVRKQLKRIKLYYDMDMHSLLMKKEKEKKEEELPRRKKKRCRVLGKGKEEEESY